MAATAMAPSKRRAPQKDRLKAVKDGDTTLSHYPDRYLRCRDLRHAWELVGYWHDGGWIHRELECLRCGTGRHDSWSANGWYAKRSYDYSDDYQIQSEYRVEMRDVRAEVLSRVHIYETAEAMHAAADK